MESKQYFADRNYKIRTIADHYDYEQQSHITIEECSELIKAISKCERRKTDNFYRSPEYSSLIEEMADVQIMIWQLQYLVDPEFDMIDVIDQKLDRQIERIKGEK